MKVFYSGPVENNIMTVMMSQYMVELLSEDDLKDGVIVDYKDKEPQPLPQGDKPVVTKKLDMTTKQIIYEYSEALQSKEELMAAQISDLQAQNAQAILALVAGGLM